MSTTPAPAEADARFGFGENWRRFLRGVDESRIRAAEHSLIDMLNVPSLAGRTFLDVGSGSGLFSLAAARLGADEVHSFDVDPDSVACTEELRRRFAPDARWRIEHGSVLDDAYLTRLGRWHVVYSWGVLHHTGNMWGALDRAGGLVAPDGQLFIAIYNDQGLRSKLWTIEKRLYVQHAWLRPALIAGGAGALVSYAAVKDLRRGRLPWRRYTSGPTRGMSFLPDLIDWLGGYPFEVASPQAISRFYESRGFAIERVNARATSGCNEFVFRRSVPERHSHTP
jgi:2-polyprenyl-6-hydroxyphenyl methylase/3-demethylubiquinone-9 3-methyltransferase